MRILHTSDWHLGKSLEEYSRLPEQQQFLDELCEIVEARDIDFVIVAGDIYDSSNPGAEAERLFYKGVNRLSNQGKRPVLIIAGNHDSPERLMAVSPLAREHGVIIAGTPKTVVETSYHKGFSVIKSGEGFIELEIKGEKAVILLMPYPSERRLNEVIGDEESIQADERSAQTSYGEKIAHLFSQGQKFFREDTITIVAGHFYMTGGESSGSERDISLGGALMVPTSALPKGTQYVALGHLHRPQKISCGEMNIYYSGSPLQYSKSEAGYAKAVYIADIQPSQPPIVEKVTLKNYKPITILRANSIEESLEQLERIKNESCYVYLEIRTSRPILLSELKEMRAIKSDIVEIMPMLYTTDEEALQGSYAEKTIFEEFEGFYKELRGVEPTAEIVQLFKSLCLKGEGEETAIEAD